MRYNDKYDANYKFRRELNRDNTSRVGEMASYPEDVMNEAIDKVYRELDEHDRVIIDGMLNMLQNFADKNGRRGFGDLSRKELLVKLGLWLNDNPGLVNNG
jgi:hypothetical protein